MKSDNGFQTNVWGAPMWLCLHLISLNYKPEMKEGYKAFFESLAHVLPCGSCRNNYKSILESRLPLNETALQCRKSMAMWVFLLHNTVQQDIFAKTGESSQKPKFKNTMKDFKRAMQFYEGFRAQCVKNQHGCVTPLKGSRKRTKIDIVKFSKPRVRDAVVNKTLEKSLHTI